MKKKNFLRNLSTTALPMCCLSSSVALPSFASFEENSNNSARPFEEEEEIDDDDDGCSNYNLPGRKDRDFPSENFESLKNPPLHFGHNNDYGCGNFGVPNEENPKFKEYEEYCKAIKSNLNKSTKFFNFDPDRELPFSSSIDVSLDEHADQVSNFVDRFLKEDKENGTYDETGGPLYKKLHNAHYLNLVSLNPSIVSDHFKKSSTSYQDYFIKDNFEFFFKHSLFFG